MSVKEDSGKKVMKIISKTMVYTFAVFGIVFILTLLGIISLLNPSAKLMPVPQETILKIDFNQKYSEVRQDDFLAEFLDGSTYSVYDLTRAIYAAADDKRVKAIEANVNSMSLGFAQVEDVVEAIEYFRNKGKKAYIFSDGMGSFGSGSKEYYLATAFDEIWLQPNSDIGITGVEIEVPFFKNILQKVGVTPEFYARHEYKTAMSSLTENDFTPAFREEMHNLGNGLYQIWKIGVVLRRNPKEQIEDLVNRAPLFAEDAVEAGLADKLGYRQELEQYLKELYNAKPIKIEDYMSHFSDNTDKSLPTIGFMVLEGVISDGKSSNNPLDEAVIGSETVMEQLEDLKKHPNLKALVIRLNSPGGSYAASNAIWFALEQFKKEKNIPIVVSMSDYAASGGYFIALAGDLIVAEKTTLTGSIGVFGGKFVLADLWKKLDINWGEMKFGANADILSANHAFTPQQKELFNKSLDKIYDDFTQKVAQKRGLTPEQINDAARGRIWLGQNATSVNLVDELGGAAHAVMRAKEIAGLKAQEEISFVYYPRKPSFQEKLTKFIETGGGMSTVKSFKGFGITFEQFKFLQRLQYDTVLPPFKINM